MHHPDAQRRLSPSPAPRQGRKPLRAPRDLQMGGLLGHLSAKPQGGLALDLYQRLVDAILEARMVPGSALPSTRWLAGALGLSRNTVIHAYARLVQEGFVLAESRSRYVVAAGEAAPATLPAQAEDGGFTPDLPGSVAGLPRLEKGVRWHGCQYAFLYGRHDPLTFPVQQWREVERGTLAVPAIRGWAADAFHGDDPALIAQIRERVLPQRGIWAGADEVLITLGAQSGMGLIAALLVGRDTLCAFDDPGHADLCSVLRMHSDRIEPVPVDEQGLRVDLLPPRVDLLCTAPSHQYPTTVTLSQPRRLALMEYARRNGTIIVEEDHDAEVFYGSRQIPALRSLDQHGHVIYLGSFAKGLAPGLMIGYIVAQPRLIEELRLIRRLMWRAAPANNQQAVATFLERGYYDSLIKRLRRIYADRCQTLTESLAAEASPIRFRPPTGGSAAWLGLPAPLRGRDFAETLLARGVYVETGDHLFSRRPESSFLRLGFTAMTREMIRPGIAILGQALRDTLD